MSNLLNVSSSPHIRNNDSTRNIMGDVTIALLPATAYGIYNFGVHALLVVLATVVTCLLTEYIYQRAMKLPVTVNDLSAIVTGLLLAMNMPPEIPIWIPMIGGVFAILVVKQIFGGLGQNFMNPALAARCFLLISFAGRMTTFTLDGVTGPTPLAVLKSTGEITNISSMFIGNISGTIGETSALALLIGAAYLFFKKVISWRIPVIYIGTFMIFIALFGKHSGADLGQFMLMHLFGGGLMLGAFFMATDYVTSPITPLGQIIFAVLLGFLTGIFRLFGGSAEGVSYAIIISNLLVPLIEKVTIPKAFGKEAVKNGK